ncbi:SRPBCC family protein [Chitinophagaceae bacterium MMS25-I14]
MEKKDYSTTVAVNASPGEVMKKIGLVDGWWAKNFTGKADALHDKFQVRFGETSVDFEISELVPGKKVVWKVTDCYLHWLNDKKEWNGTKVVFDISPEGNETQINFTHVGLVPGMECYNNCNAGWNGHVTGSLATFINKGKGMPE